MAAIQGAAAFNVVQSIPVVTAFAQGALSFFSPCVLPLLPVYLGYLAGGGQEKGADGQTIWPRKRVLMNTLFFVLGVSFTLMLLGMAFSSLGQFFRKNRTAVNLICGAVVILFGLLQLGLWGKGSFLQREFRLPLRLDRLRMNPATALLMGLCFSFSWTPCIGPTLSGILMTAAAAESRTRGIILMVGYIVGFILPFLAVGLFTGAVLSFFRKHRGMVRWTTVISGALMVIMGVLIMTGTMGEWSSLLASAAAEEETAEAETMMAPDFTLEDQYGNIHTLSEYQGKVVFMNFWTTWCPYCVQEMPEIEEVYHELGENEGDVVILGMCAPSTHDSADLDGVMAFVEEHGWTYPMLMDMTGEVFDIYVAGGYPTTWMIKADGTLMGYVSGMMDKETMTSIIQQTLEKQGV